MRRGFDFRYGNRQYFCASCDMSGCIILRLSDDSFDSGAYKKYEMLISLLTLIACSEQRLVANLKVTETENQS